jgi:hypothetical protein
MDHRETNAATKEHVEVLAVSDPAHEQPHCLLVATTRVIRLNQRPALPLA